MNKNKVILRGLEVNTSIGIYDFEKSELQPLIISMEIEYLSGKEFTNDNIDDTLNYEKILDVIKKTCAQKHYNLLETLAEDLCNHILSLNGIDCIKLLIEKPNVLKSEKSGIIGVELVRHNK